jgi:hypothetical protein
VRGSWLFQEVSYLGNYHLRLRFKDGQVKDPELKAELPGKVFEPLKNQEFFQLAKVDPDTQTVAWPNGADFAPEYLSERGQTVRKIA